MKKLAGKILCYTIFASSGVFGGYLGMAIQSKAFPVQVLERALITPEVKPGEAALMAQHVNRIDQCDIVIKRVISTSTGQRIGVRQEFEDGFGPIGGDRYILPIPIPETVSLGPAKIYSKAYSVCSWLDYIRPSEAEGWTMNIVFADRTEFSPLPHGFEHIGVKTPKPPAPVQGPTAP